METQKISLYKIALKWGLIGVGATALSSIIFLIFGLYDKFYRLRETAENSIYLIALILSIIISIYVYKKATNGFLKVGKVLQIGLIVATISALGIIIYYLIFINLLYPDYYTDYYYGTNGERAWEDYLALAPETHTRETYDAHAQEGLLREYQMYPLFLIFNNIISLIISPIAGLIMRKKKAGVNV